MTAFIDGERQVFHFLSGICSNCQTKSSRWAIPGSLECVALIGWPVPKEVLDYQLSIELAFLDHPLHPHNKDYAQ